MTLSQHFGRSSQRGVSVFEAKLIAVCIAVLGAGGLYLAHRANDAEREVASHNDAVHILEAAENHLANDGTGCPTVSSLKRDALLNSSAPASDAWGERFVVTCDGPSVSVSSAGPDGRRESGDDVRVDRSRS